MLFYVVAYDTPCNKRRRKFSHLLEGYGQRVQYSVFECVLSREKFVELRYRLRQQFKADEDSLRFYPISSHTMGQIEVWGEPPLSEPPSSVII